MTDRIIIATPFGPIAVPIDAFREFRKAADALMPSEAPPSVAKSAQTGPLATAAETAEALGVAVSKVRELARTGAIPVVRLGRYHRFDLGAVRAALDQRSTERSLAENRIQDPGLAHPGFTRVSVSAPPSAPRVRPGRRSGAAQVVDR